MKLEHLKLSNFRGFRSFEITFDPSFTVLLGQNMAGKSAVLDGAAVALGGFFRGFSPSPIVRLIASSKTTRFTDSSLTSAVSPTYNSSFRSPSRRGVQVAKSR